MIIGSVNRLLICQCQYAISPTINDRAYSYTRATFYFSGSNLKTIVSTEYPLW